LAKEKGTETFFTKDFFVWKKWSKVVIFEGEFLFFWKWPYLDHKLLHVASINIHGGVSNNIYFSL
jgi:hypothetical protein